MTRPDDGLALGLDVGGTKVALALVDAAGRVHQRARIATAPERGAEVVLADVAAAARAHFGGALDAVRGVGIAVAGQVGGDGVLHGAPNLGWTGVPLCAFVARVFDGRAAAALNDVRAATLAEWRVGAARGVDDVVALFLGTGVGGGVVTGGRLLGGARGTAGELGHGTVVAPGAGGRACHCRNVGCLEAYAGGWAIAERAREAVGAATAGEGAALLARAGGAADAIVAAHVTAAAAAGDPLAARLVTETLDAVAAGVVTLVNAFDPACVLFGGGVADALPALVAHVTAAVRARALLPAAHEVRVERAALGNDAPAVGAALAALGLQPVAT
jgi:glucokinase